MRAALALCCCVASGCLAGQSVVQVTFDAPTGAQIQNIDHFGVLVTATVGGQQKTATLVNVPATSTTLPPTAAFALRFDPSVDGAATINVGVYTAAETLITVGVMTVDITPSKSQPVHILLAPACGDGSCESTESCGSCRVDCCPECVGKATTENTAAACNDGCDNDGNGETDCNDIANCCSVVQCDPSTACGARQACQPCSAGSCANGATCGTRVCDGLAGCFPTNSGCTTIGGASCPSVANYDVCTSTAQCATGTSCSIPPGDTTTTMRCWPNSGTSTGSCPPAFFCPSTATLLGQCVVSTSCEANPETGQPICQTTCHLACAGSSGACPTGMTCSANGFCQD